MRQPRARRPRRRTPRRRRLPQRHPRNRRPLRPPHCPRPRLLPRPPDHRPRPRRTPPSRPFPRSHSRRRLRLRRTIPPPRRLRPNRHSRPRNPYAIRRGARGRPSRLRRLRPPRRKKCNGPPHPGPSLLRTQLPRPRPAPGACPNRAHVGSGRRASRHPRRHARVQRLPPPPIHAPGRPRTGSRPLARQGGPGA